MAVQENRNVSQLPILKEGANFTNWKFRLLLLLDERDVGNILVDEITKENKLSDSKAKSIIVQCLSDKYLEYVKKATTAKEMLICLENIFERKSTFNKLHLRRQLLTMKCNFKEKLQDHFLKFDSLINSIEALGSKLDEDDKVCHLLLTMPTMYDNVVTAIETMSVDKSITLDFVKSCLLDAEIKKNEQSQNVKGNENVFTAPKYIECFKCHKKGHIAAECKTKCYVKYGHNRYNKNVNRHGASTSEQTYISEENQDYYEFIALNEESVNTINTNNTIEFIIDSGATENMVNIDFERYMNNIEILNKKVNIKIANGDSIYAIKKGILPVYNKGKKINIEALIVPKLFHNIISVKKLVQKKYKVLFDNYGAKIIYRRNVIYCNNRNGLYTFTGTMIYDEVHVNICNKNVWHQRLGHLNRQGLKIMKLPVSNEVCEPCMKSKSTRLPFKQVMKPRSKSIGELIYTDIAGPITPLSLNGEKYFQTITDDYSHFVKVYLLKQKSEAADNIINYVREINTQKGVKIKHIRCDNGGEFSSKYFKEYCVNKGIIIEYTRPYSPQQNGVAERLNRTLYNKARTILLESGLPKELWSEAIMCGAYQINRCPSMAINNQIPAQIYYGKVDLKKMRVFGAKAWAIILPRNNKLYERSQEVRMVGYAMNGYRLWDPNTNEIIISRDVKFDESQIKYANNINDEENKIENVLIEHDDVNKYMPKDTECAPNEVDKETGRIPNTEGGENICKRQIKKPNYLNDYELYTAYCLIMEQDDPKTYDQAISRDKEWKEAIDKEINAHIKMHTWSIVDMPKGNKAIDCKWIFRTKEDGTKKARIVAKGFQEDNNFNNNYAPVARLTTIRLLLAHSIQKGWNVKQLDIPTAFLNSNINSEVYMKAPKGLIVEKGKVLKMNKGLYGLKESPKCWNNKFNEFANEYGLIRSKNDFCLYVGYKVLLVIFVDDILITGEDNEISKLINHLKIEFKAKELGEVKNFLGMEINRKGNEIKITQKRQIEKMLEKFNMEDCNGAKSPMTKGFQVENKEEEIEVPYRMLIGSLMFVCTASRPDICYAVSYLSQYLDKPKNCVWIEGKRVLRYLKETINLGLTYQKGKEQKIETYSDADWASNKEDRKSTSGSVSRYCGNTISWFSRKQACVSLSTAEAEYIAAATSVCDLINIQGLSKDFNEDIKGILYVDNRGAIDMTQSFENSKRTKHIDIRYHFIKDLVISNTINIQYVESKSNLADMFTKVLSNEHYYKFRNELNIV